MSTAARVGLQQRVLPAYRVGFFDALAVECPAGLSVFAGRPQSHEALGQEGQLELAQFSPANNAYLGKMPDCLFWQGNITGWLNAWQPDVLILEANPRNLSLPLASRWMRSRRKPVIGWGLGAPGARSSLPQRQIYQRFLSLFDAVIAYSSQGADQYAAAGVSPERIFVAHNAVAHRPTGAPPERPPFGLDRPPILLYVGRLQPRKRLDLLLQACAGLGKGSRPEVWIAGDGPARPELEELAKNIYPHVQFWGDRRGAELAALFMQADLFVLPGTGGLAVQEAMAAGLPVMVAQGDGTQNDLVRSENGWLLPPGDLEALRLALQDALSDPTRLRRMGSASYRIVVEEVNLEQMVSVFRRAISCVK